MITLLTATLLSFEPTVISTATEVNDGITKDTLVVSFGDNPIEEFQVHSVYRESCPFYVDIVWPSPVGFSIDRLEVLPEELPYTANFFGTGAQFCVNWIVIDEPGVVPLGGCESGEYDCSLFTSEDWGMSLRLDMIDYALGELKNPHLKPIIAGEVAGAMVSGVAVNEFTDTFSGLGLINGSIYALPDTGIQEFNAVGCAMLEALPPFITYDTTVQWFDALLTGARDTPDAPVVAPELFLLSTPPLDQLLVDEFGSPTVPTYREAWYMMMTVHVENLNWPGPDYVYCTPDGQGGFEYCDEDELLGIADSLRPYADLGMLKDLLCTIGSGAENPYVDNIGDFEGGVFAIVDALAFGPAMPGYLDLFTSAGNMKTLVSDRAENDRIHSVSRFWDLDAPFISWAWWTYLTQQ